MPKVEDKIEVPAQAQEIFDYLADFSNIPRLQPHFESARIVSEELRGQGAVVELRGHFHGMPMRVRNRIITFAPPNRLVSISEGTVLSRNVWELRPLDGDGDGRSSSTEVGLTIEYKIAGPLGGIFMGLAHSLFHGEVEKMLSESLRRLREAFLSEERTRLEKQSED